MGTVLDSRESGESRSPDRGLAFVPTPVHGPGYPILPFSQTSLHLAPVDLEELRKAGTTCDSALRGPKPTWGESKYEKRPTL